MDRLLRLLELVAVASEDGDPSALHGGLAGHGEADAARSAGDEHVAAFDWDSDGFGADDEVEEDEEREREDEDKREKG